ncbi:mCpol domain-containing protein [Serratia fonticola]|uniref:MCpol domain-containing protein n=1 Tax=Serratia fonticola TaxID=47917 RepID=A0ABY9PJS1_SERFO|nr:mCpol domain-containing protein [Serratia fonticola]WMT13508.1 mCpol domain-containing protein [Serratia fonticola]
MIFFTIDGDDIGRKITHAYIRNDVELLAKISSTLATTTKDITQILINHGFNIIFSAADGVAAYTEDNSMELTKIFESINNNLPEGITYSAGCGKTLRNAYIALLDAKSSGKNKIITFK